MQSKRHPDIFAAGLKELVDPACQEVIVVGDTRYDAEAAGKLDLRTVGVFCGGFQKMNCARRAASPSSATRPT